MKQINGKVTTRVNNVAYSRLSTNLYASMKEGKEKAELLGKQVLVSSVIEINKTDLPAFFSYQEHRYRGRRFFWSEPGRVLSFVGLGEVFKLETNDKHDRFKNVDTAWKEMANLAIVKDKPSPYTGPILFGGFSFDPYHAQTDKWSDFAHTSFAVPKFMITAHEGRYFLTSNRFVGPDESSLEQDDQELEQLIHALPQLKEMVCTEQAHEPNAMIREEIAPSDWMSAVDAAASSIRKGELEKVVLARSLLLLANDGFRSEAVLRSLLDEQQNTYVFAIDKPGSCFIGATPEQLIKRQGQQLFTLSLAGSIARGQTSGEDAELASFLKHDIKNLHEHRLAVDMIKGAMQQLCAHVEAPDEPIIRKLKDIQHLATPIAGEVKEGVSLLQAVEALHPTPALGGMPRELAMEAIRRLEDMDRGWYAAPIGWMNVEQEGEFVGAIRSALLLDKQAYLFAGCGIVGDSEPLSEYKETALKFTPMLKALQALEMVLKN